MLREYEFTLVARTDGSEADSAKTFEKYEKVLLNGSGEIIKKDDWGTKKFAYPMKKQFRGHYTFYDIAADKDNIAEAERLMRIDDNVLRYLLIKVKDDVDVAKRKAELAEQAAAKQQQQQQ